MHPKIAARTCRISSTSVYEGWIVKGRLDGSAVKTKEAAFMLVSKYDDSRLLLALRGITRGLRVLAAHWGNDIFAEPRPYSSVVLAAQEHDNGWWE